MSQRTTVPSIYSERHAGPDEKAYFERHGGIRLLVASRAFPEKPPMGKECETRRETRDEDARMHRMCRIVETRICSNSIGFEHMTNQ
jgi:hypothetical protein